MRQILAVILVLAVAPAQAALVSHGTFTTDTDSSLDWLDLDQTAGMTMSDALTANSGWRHADYSEIDNLYATVFPGVPNPVDLGFTNIYGNSAEQQAYVSTFSNNFSVTGVRGNTGNLTLSQGFYYGETGDVLLLGVQIYAAGGYSHIYKDYYESRQSDPGYSQEHTGVYLVRASIVPIPAAVWLFGSALARLGWFRRRNG